jgi:hypothetical protein
MARAVIRTPAIAGKSTMNWRLFSASSFPGKKGSNRSLYDFMAALILAAVISRSHADLFCHRRLTENDDFDWAKSLSQIKRPLTGIPALSFPFIRKALLPYRVNRRSNRPLLDGGNSWANQLIGRKIGVN